MRLVNYRCIAAAAAVLMCTGAASAQSDGAAASPEWSIGPITFSGLLDAYYDLNFNHPADRTNQMRAFDVKANQFTLNTAKLTMEHAADPVGFRVDLGFGRGMDLFHFNEPNFTAMKYVQQAFVSWKPPQAKGFQVDFGKFVSSAGAEVFDTHANWNYSRSLLYAWAQPYYHFGVRTTMPVGKHFTGGVQLVNGWNNVEDNNSGKTAGFTGALAFSKVSWANTYYVGPEKTDTNKGIRHLCDSVLTLTPNKKTSIYLNYDYLSEARTMGGSYRVTGIGGAARFQVNNWFAVTPRVEWLNDADGFSTGTVQKVKEFTMTGEFKMKEGLLTRVEYRRDWSNAEFFNRGNHTANWNKQDTVLVGLVAYFGPKR